MGVVNASAIVLRFFFLFVFFKCTDIKQALEVKGNRYVGWLEPQK